jgi:hypothetical protein
MTRIGRIKKIRVIRAIRGSFCFLFVLAVVCDSACGDGGTLRLSQRAGDRMVSVFTSPTPLRAGRVDVSVYVQDAASAVPIERAEVFVTATPLDRRGEAVRRRATVDQATNKLFQAAEFDLPEAGRWRFSLETGDPRQPRSLSFEADLAEPPPRWLALAPWIGWPWLLILAFFARQFVLHESSGFGLKRLR